MTLSKHITDIPGIFVLFFMKMKGYSYAFLLIFRLISPHIMLPYLIQLKLYRTSTPSTNHAVVKMMHRVAVEMKFPEMFFQLSTFIVFKEALEINLPEFKVKVL